MFKFSILEIYAGWFTIQLVTENTSVSLTNSSYLNNDAPKILLKNIKQLSSHYTDEVWFCWHDEPGAYIGHMRVKNKVLELLIAEAIDEAVDLPPEGVQLKEAPLGTVLFDAAIPLEKFVKKIRREFTVYSSGVGMEKYEKEWMEFPLKEFNALK